MLEMTSLKIILADDHPVFLESLALLIAKIPGCEVAGKMNNGKEVLSWLEHSPADLILTDIQMPGMGGLELIAAVRRLYPSIKILILTMLEDAETIREALQAGASGYIFKSASLADFEKALNTAASGSSYYSEEVMRRLIEKESAAGGGGAEGTGEPGGPGGGNSGAGLTERELDVVRLIAAELTSAEIAGRLFISLNTVESHRKNIFQKTGVKNSVGLIQYARRKGLI
jgi:DNA-binding NarL/FixJ family response regulator